MPMATIHKVALALDAWVDFGIRWRGGELDRAINARHASLHEAVAKWIDGLGGWTLVPEVSFSVYGERGVIDGLAWHARTATLLVIELKTELIDISEVLGTFDRKIRLAPEIAQGRGWRPLQTAGWLLVADGRTNHRRLADHRNVVRARLPDDGRHVRRWLGSPSGPLMALSFLPVGRIGKPGTTLAATKRVRRRIRAVVGPAHPAG